MNTKFHYLYRDGNNYKNHGELVLVGSPNDLKEWEKELRGLLDDREHFIASQINVPEVFHFQKGWPVDSTSDHCWHEYTYTEETDEPATDKRSPKEFLDQIREESTKGWDVFQPA